MFETIERATSRANQEVLLSYSDGVELIVDFNPIILKGGVFASLADPSVFEQANVGEGGRYIEWPGGIDFCADALRKQGRATALPSRGKRRRVRSLRR